MRGRTAAELGLGQSPERAVLVDYPVAQSKIAAIDLMAAASPY